MAVPMRFEKGMPERSRLIRLHNLGMCPTHIAKSMGCGYSSVTAVLKECGLEPHRKQRDGSAKGKDPTPEEIGARALQERLNHYKKKRANGEPHTPEPREPKVVKMITERDCPDD